MIVTATRYHDFSAGHRVVGHENKCAWLHGHNYRVHFTCTAPRLDGVGRVIDFSAIKSVLCTRLEQEWDHKFIAWVEDPLMMRIYDKVPESIGGSIVWIPFNPTAENMAQYLLEVIGPQQLVGVYSDVRLVSVLVEETRKCSARATL
jgi:6-pyruvoyltetrahydropterin/6-carboxytetrahydropterin synthase